MPPPTTAFRRAVHRQAVRYLECDQQGVVFNMWYLAYLDEALGALLADGGLRYPELMDRGLDVQLVHTELDWAGPLRFGDTAAVETAVEGLGTTSFTVRFTVRAEPAGVVAATGRTVYVVVALDGSGKQPIPPWLAAILRGG